MTAYPDHVAGPPRDDRNVARVTDKNAPIRHLVGMDTAEHPSDSTGTAAPAVAVGVDVGGSKLVLGIVHADGSISDQQRVRTERRDPGWVTDRIVSYARQFGAGLPVGVAAAGAADKDGVLTFGAFINWDGYPLRANLIEHLGVNVFVQNDVTVAAWGEYILDPHRRSVVVIAAGTGVGGGAVSDGTLIIGRGAAMEIGHLHVTNGTAQCACGKIGCLETVASGSAVSTRYHHAKLQADPSSIEPILPAPHVVAAAMAGDELAIRVLREAGEALGEAAAIIAAVLDPERIVLTGGLVHGAAELILTAARSTFGAHLSKSQRRDLSVLQHSTAETDPIVLGAGALATRGIDVQPT